jgi:hypothetical protein
LSAPKTCIVGVVAFTKCVSDQTGANRLTDQLCQVRRKGLHSLPDVLTGFVPEADQLDHLAGNALNAREAVVAAFSADDRCAYTHARTNCAKRILSTMTIRNSGKCHPCHSRMP